MDKDKDKNVCTIDNKNLTKLSKNVYENKEKTKNYA